MSTSTEEDPDTMPEAELLALPGGAIQPGWLSEFFARRSAIVHQHDFDELNLERAGDSGRRSMLFPGQDPNEKRRREEEQQRALVAYEQSMADIRQHSDRLLAQIEVRQQKIEKQRQEIEDRAIKLHDGRRVFVDGNSYRDEQGRVLTGDDAREADDAHRDKPNASTWQERQKNIDEAAEEERLRQQVLKERQDAERSGQGLSAEEMNRQRKETEQRMTGYEKEFSEKVDTASASLAAKTPDDLAAAYSTDYSAAYGSVTPNDYAGPAGGEGKTSLPDFARAVAGQADADTSQNAPQSSAGIAPKVQT
jgi:hypothetical protein